MKKIIALFAVTTVLCSFVSCGKNNADESSEKSSSSSVEEVSEEKAEETTEEAAESETEEVVEGEISETESEAESTDESSENSSTDGSSEESNQESIDSVVNTIIKASNTSLTELDEMGVAIPDCIISSDHTKNYNVSDDFLSQFEKEMDTFYPEYKNYNYFIVIKGGLVEYSAANAPENPDSIGTYPAEKVYSADGEFTDKDENCTFDELYNTCLEQMQ